MPRLRHGALALALCLGAVLAAPSAASTATTTTIDPGQLPATSAKPSTTTGVRSVLHVVWRAIVSDNPTLARRSFFPRTAYIRMKQGLLANPASDYDARLLAFYNLDLAAYHQRIVPGARPVLVGVKVHRSDAAWIPPGACENLIGYWHLAGVRLVFRKGARVWSVAVASLISWRGVWYVVHLGPNPRARNVGTIDDWRAGPGVAGPAGGC
ncbi:MAG TPA: hypothetical protein VMV53_01165 [Acidimicrobiales bacterium]|nr:hypothetical protein [Acidimicrobiales bacterium]